jgi:hypothetical protein
MLRCSGIAKPNGVECFALQYASNGAIDEIDK